MIYPESEAIRALDLPDLPNDVLDEIFSYLPGLRPWDLKACCLVCHRWNDLCKPHLFYTRGLGGRSLNHDLHFVYHSYPSLPQFVRVLRLFLKHMDRNMLSDCIPDCFHLFTGIRTLVLSGVYQYSKIKLPMRRGVEILLSAPLLQRLDLSQWAFDEDGPSTLAGLLKICSDTLLHLSLEGTFMNFLPNAVPEYNEPPVQMRALKSLLWHVGYDCDFVLNYHLIRCPSLREYIVRVVCAVRRREQPLLPVFIDTHLEEFAIEVERLDNSAPKFDFGQSVQISKLTLDLDSYYETSSFFNIFHWISQSILALSHPNQLQKLTLNIKIDHPDSHSPMAADCVTLSETLHHLLRNGRLSHVQLHLSIFFFSDRGDEDASICRTATLLELREGFSALGCIFDPSCAVVCASWFGPHAHTTQL